MHDATAPNHSVRNNLLVALAVVALMATGGYLRFLGLSWDDYTMMHPDERFLMQVTSSLGGGHIYVFSDPESLTIEQLAIREACLERYPTTMGTGGYFDAQCSTYNPHNLGHSTFVYGTLPVFMFRGVAELFASVTGDPGWTGLIQTFTPARTVSAIAETLIILVIFCAGLRAHDKWVGLLAAALYTFTAFSIQQAHFGTADATANLFVALTILFSICIQRDGKLRDYAFFGAFLACALASRINLLPLVGLLFVVAVLRLLPALSRGIDRDEREAIWTQVGVGVIVSLLTTFVVFRLLNPYAFMGPSVFGVTPNREWFDDVALSRFFVSGDYEAPPNWQWVARPRYIFALWNMVAWGMGLALGIVGWIAALVAFWRIIRGKAGALANVMPTAWIVAYFGFTGGLWVMTMRYYLPLYPSLALLAAWAIVTLVRARRRVTDVRADAMNGVPTSRAMTYRPAWLTRAFGWTLLLVVVGFTTAWGLGFAQNYTRLLTRVEGSYWFWEQVPGDFAMRIDDAPEGTPLINIAIANSQYVGRFIDWEGQATRFPDAGTSYYSDFTAHATGTVSSIIAPHLGDLTDTPGEEVFRFNVLRKRDNFVVGATELSADLTRENHILGDRYDIPFDTPIPLEEGEEYRFIVTLQEGMDVVSGGSLVVWEGDWDDPMPQKTCTPSDGLSLMDNPPPGRFSVYDCNGRDVYWALNGGGYKLQMADNDSPAARENILNILETTDYIFIGSNRFYDTMSRNRTRWPFANRYYDALFSGELGFEVAAVFDRGFHLGPLYIPSNNLPMFGSPNWMNELEAEEAFHVYDHPAVIIFRKTDDYSQERAVAILNSVPMQTSVAARPLFNCSDNPDSYYCDETLIDTDLLVSTEAARVPTYLQIPEEDIASQRAGATWSERFDSDAAINTNQVLTVVVWWLAMVVFGWIAFPLLFALLPALADRGYGMAKAGGLLLTAWAAWYVASLHIPAWNARGILVVMLGLLVLSMLAAWRVRSDFVRFIRARWRMMLGIELIALLAFLFFVGVRLTNPDLWHFAFGGEKPMDFAYFNGVLRSSVFPPIDPWYAGGFINYYYFGFVLVGTPTLLLGVMPQIAYNLAIPTIFALTAIGAFSVAYNIASALGRTRGDDDANTDEASVDTNRRSARPRLNPWLAGVAALLLAVLLGNLDTPRTFFTGVMALGGYEAPGSLADFLVDRAEAAANGEFVDYVAIQQQAQNPSLGDQIAYAVSGSQETLRALGTGTVRMFQGAPLPIPPHRWYWGPTRIFNENPADLGIVEMPYFTFLYGDLHAHMIALPLQLLAIGVLMHEVFAARRGGRSNGLRFGSLALLGITVGMLNATNSWDWITYLVLSMVGLSFAWWLAWHGKLSRASVLAFVGMTGGFFVIQYVASLPYTSWFASVYSSIKLWEGDKSSLWGLLSVHGLFLFLVVSLLLWETGRWFRSVYLRDLRQYGPLLFGGLVVVLTTAFGVMLAVLRGYQAALIVVPLILWIALLFFRPGQSRAMQYLLAIVGLALSLMLGVEVIVLSGDIGRMNTMFKFYMQVWLMFSVVGGVAFAVLWRSLDEWHGALRNAWVMVLVALVTLAALFPLMATRGRALDRFSLEVPTTLDGMAYMNYAVHGEQDEYIPLEGDYAMIRWMQENIVGLPTIIEAQSEANLYKWGSRISIYTGLPSVIGWDWHQTQQRGLFGMPGFVRQRGSNVNAFYNTRDIATAQRILDFYNVEYIVVGALERVYYPAENLAKLDEMVERGLLEIVYEAGEDRIYHVLRADEAAIAQR
jgi:YYY domain-containing protein